MGSVDRPARGGPADDPLPAAGPRLRQAAARVVTAGSPGSAGAAQGSGGLQNRSAVHGASASPARHGRTSTRSSLPPSRPWPIPPGGSSTSCLAGQQTRANWCGRTFWTRPSSRISSRLIPARHEPSQHVDEKRIPRAAEAERRPDRTQRPATTGLIADSGPSTIGGDGFGLCDVRPTAGHGITGRAALGLARPTAGSATAGGRTKWVSESPHITQIWMTSVLIGIEPTPTQAGMRARWRWDRANGV